VPAGNKGLGRLAALRLGHEVEIVSRPASEPEHQYRLLINWDDFDDVELVEDVALPISREVRSPGSNPGVQIEIRRLRDRLGRMDVKRLARSLILLADPFSEDPSSFVPAMVTPEFDDLARLVSNRYFLDADFHLVASVDGRGIASARVVDWRGEELFRADHHDLAAGRDDRPYEMPPADFDLWAYLLDRDNFTTRSSSLREVREWIRAFGGVHLYINGLRVAPYGNAGNDWLDMNLSRSASPQERPSTNNSIGRVSLHDPHGLLSQKTDRTGLIENERFAEMREFGRDALNWMARRRLEVARQRRATERATAQEATRGSREAVEDAISQAPSPSQPLLRREFARYDRSRQREADRLRKEVQLYRTLSTAGITAATFAHESGGSPLKVISQSVLTVERRSKRQFPVDLYNDQLREPIDRLKRAAKSLAVLSSVTLGLVNRDRLRSGRVELHGVIRRTLSTFAPFVEGRDVEVTLTLASGNPYVQGTEAAVESIITNLLNNSLTALEDTNDRQRRIDIKTGIIERTFSLIVQDNGPGIEGIALRDIWLPSESTRGTGLGLAIVRDAVDDLGGAAKALEHGGLDGGALFSIQIPILGA
jgi:signal transduction histidine kinase